MSRFRKYFTAPVLILVLLAVPVLAEVISQAAKGAGFTRHDLAYYLDENLVNFVRPGFKVKIVSASIQDSKLSVRFTITDPKGLPLDRDGITTPGTISTSFIAAYIPQGKTLYTAYTTRSATSPITGTTAVQAGTDSGGTYTRNADGDYTYAFKTALPSGYDATATHSIGVYGSRNLSEFGLKTYYDDYVYTFVPAGGEVKTVRDIIATDTCNKCHDAIAFHGGPRRSVELCILCHQPQTVDPDTGNSVDMTEMVHKIHMGKDLPSVKAGKPYQIIGHNQSVYDYSTVGFPDSPNHCEACHTTVAKPVRQASNIKLTGAGTTAYLMQPSRRACGACHDDVNFASGEKHAAGAQTSDNMCANCHIPEGEMEFDASIKGAHTIPQFSKQLYGIKFGIVKVENTAPGKNPTVTFTLKDKGGNVVDIATMNSLSLLLAGPTTDYSSYISESAKAATLSGGAYVYTFKAAIPADAKGTFAVAVEGYRNATLNAGMVNEIKNIRDTVSNPFFYFGVTDSKPVPRRVVVDEAKCNKCHGTLMLHGTFRRSVQYCIICHNPNQDDVPYRKAADLPTESVNFKTMIHKIHTGEELTTDYTVIGYRGSVINFNEIRYPGDRRNCEQCHVAGTYELPLPDGVIAQKAPRDYINPLQPISGACLSCHTSKSAAAHASIMTSPTLGESCEACHGKSSEASVVKAHAR